MEDLDDEEHLAPEPDTATVSEAGDRKRNRVVKNFPALSFEDCEKFAASIYKIGSGNPVRRLTLLGELGKSPDSSATRMLITTSAKYGLTKGSYKADLVELTEPGRRCVSEDTRQRDRLKTRFQLAIEGIAPFNGLYQENVNLKRPANAALADAIQRFGVSDETADEAVETFIVNLKYAGLLRNVSGAERILSLEHVLEEMPSAQAPEPIAIHAMASLGAAETFTEIGGQGKDPDNVCFYITPIGPEDSEQRRHSDLFLGSIVEPALQSLGLTVLRADKIQKAGSITRQILEYVINSKLVVADLSFHNPNVFYELAIRHVARKPVVQIVRKGDPIPFDINQQRTIQIDNSSIYELVPMLETYRAEISMHARAALENADASDNPIATFFPSIKMSGIQEQ